MSGREIAVENPPLPPDTSRDTTADVEPAQESSAPVSPVGESMHAIEAAAQAVVQAADPTDYPTEIVIPSIRLDTRIIKVGVNAKGEMDVPDGNTNDVGWYKDGTVPGMTGSAVLDAHVFAAFKGLSALKPGSDVFVVTQNNNQLHFKVQEMRYYRLADVPLNTLFNRDDAKRLNLITCAGKLTKDRSTYDHRLIVYATLVD